MKRQTTIMLEEGTKYVFIQKYNFHRNYMLRYKKTVFQLLACPDEC